MQILADFLIVVRAYSTDFGALHHILGIALYRLSNGSLSKSLGEC